MSPEIRSFCRARSLSIRSTRRANPLSGSRYHLSTTQGKCASTSCLNKPYKSTLSPKGRRRFVTTVVYHLSGAASPDSRRISAQARLIEGNAAQPGDPLAWSQVDGGTLALGASSAKGGWRRGVVCLRPHSARAFAPTSKELSARVWRKPRCACVSLREPGLEVRPKRVALRNDFQMTRDGVSGIT
jgi:hypothetical protein